MESTDNIEMRPYAGAGAILPGQPQQPRRETEDKNTRDKQDDALTRDLERHTPTPAPETEYPSGIKFWLALTTLCLGIFLITLVCLQRDLLMRGCNC
jgi:hypothetical protein